MGQGWVLFWYIGVIGVAQYVAELWYAARSTGARAPVRLYALYVLAGLVTGHIGLAAGFASWLRILLYMLTLFLFCVFGLKLRPLRAAAPCIISFTLSTFYEAFADLLLEPLSTHLRLPAPWMEAAVQMGVTLALAAALVLAYRLLARRFPFREGRVLPSHLAALLLPCALIVLAIRSVLGLDRPEPALPALPAGSRAAVALWIAIAAAVFAAMIAVFHKITGLADAETQNALLEEQVRAQRRYTREALQRTGGYRALQHDIRNHLLVLRGLLRGQRYPEALAYLDKLELAAGASGPALATGSPALDVLLGEKIGYAREQGIAVSLDIRLPPPEGWDEMDLCVIFANALDNAVTAAMEAAAGNRSISVSARKHHGFLLIEIENTAGPLPARVVPGIGLNNIRRIALRHGGTLRAEPRGDRFVLSVLLSL